MGSSGKGIGEVKNSLQSAVFNVALSLPMGRQLAAAVSYTQ